jgi:xanthine dehydrogenase YagT iron-sulfur-binding subunit
MGEQSQPGTSVSFGRRAFLKGSGAAMAATALATQPAAAQTSAAAGAIIVGFQDVTLNVNGADRPVKVEPRTTLLEVLRDQLGLTGCKDLMDVSVDGADTVLLDGKATYAGTVLALQAVGKSIRTVESLRTETGVDPVIAGFVKHDAMQCGFCTPGFVMATRAFLDQHPHAGPEEIRAGLGGNLCRCGTYDGVFRCALELAKGGR